MPSKKTNRKSKGMKPQSATASTRATASKKANKAKAHKKSPRKPPAQARTTSARRSTRKKRLSVNPEREVQQEFRDNLTPTRAASRRQSADLQGLSRAEEADSESVDELVGEGNLFEAGAVAGVEEADTSDEREVHTHEVPEDDVPEEYLDKD